MDPAQPHQAPQGFSGIFDRTRIVELVQVACYCIMSCDLDVESQSGKGVTSIRSGRVVHAVTGSASGEDALREILTWTGGSFNLKSEVEEIQPSIEKAWERLLIESMRYRSTTSTGSSFTDAQFSGQIEGIDLIDLVQLAGISGLPRVLRVEAGERSDLICFRDAAVFHAECGELIGEAAFLEILLASSGTFECSLLRGDEPQTTEAPLENLLIDAQRCRDEKLADVEGAEPQARTVLQKLQQMKVAEKIKLALAASKETRAILMRDSNKMVQLAVAGNPRLTEGEVTLMAASRYSEDEVLRKIAGTREWMRLYQVRLALVTNPKCPVAISAKVIETLGRLDWKRIVGNKSVPSAISQMANRLLNKAP